MGTPTVALKRTDWAPAWNRSVAENVIEPFWAAAVQKAFGMAASKPSWLSFAPQVAPAR